MKFFRFVRLVTLIGAIGLIAAGIYWWNRPVMYRFTDLAGPDEPTVLKATPPATPDLFARGEKSRLAILLTDPNSEWLGLAHGLKTIGVPFVITRDYKEALTHKVVLVYPTISGKVLDRDALQSLAAFPRSGGTLIGFEILGGGLESVFGINKVEGARNLHQIKFDETSAKGLRLIQPEDQRITLSGKNSGAAAYTFVADKAAHVLARYDDGRAAIVQNDIGNGHTVAVGLDVGAFVAKAYNGRQEIEGQYVNAYGAGADAALRMLRTLYRSAEPFAVTLSTVPQGKAFSLVITHDIDYTRSLLNAIRYAQYERSQRIAATYFIQTKYVQDWNDDIFFNEHGSELTRKLSSLGMEIASHSVSHSRVFSQFPLGDGDERYPDYVPFVKDKLTTRNGTVLGELRVSRFLLEHAVPQERIVSFRPGHLEYPFALPEALAATGYRFSSSVTSGTALSHLPFRLNAGRAGQAQVPVYEFPITIEDENARPMTARLPAAFAILDKLKAYGGMCVTLIHPDVFDDKFAFLQALIPKAKEMGAWIGTLKDMGNWWANRDNIELDVQRQPQGIVVSLSAPDNLNGIAFEVPAGWRLDSVPANKGLRQVGTTVLIDAEQKSVQAVFH